MKKPETNLSPRQTNLFSQKNYYREIGEQAAIRIFTRNQKASRLSFLTPNSSRVLSPDIHQKFSKELKILQDLSPRDVSHIKDRVRSPAQNWSNLPQTLEDLKKTLNAGESSKITLPVVKVLSKETLDDSFRPTSQSYEKFSIEKLSIGTPSGRQNSVNLKNWLEKMKNCYCVQEAFGENASLVYGYGSRELVRQVSVLCIEQGQVLQEILLFYKRFADHLMEKMQALEKAVEEARRQGSIESIEKEKMFLDELIESQKQIDSLKTDLNQKSEYTEQLEKKISSLKVTIEEMKINFNTEESRVRLNIVRRGTLLNRRGGFESQSPLAPFPIGFEKNFDQFDKTFPVRVAVQTDRPELTIQTFTGFLEQDPEFIVEKDYQINVCYYDSVENAAIEENLTPRSELSLGVSEKSEKLQDKNKNKKKTSPVKTRLPGKRDTIKDTDKKLQEKQEELKKIIKKIKIKSAELDFIAQTLNYKKAKETLTKNEVLTLNTDPDKAFKLKPSQSKAFNLLADSEFWNGETENTEKLTLSKSMTQVFDKPVNENKNEQLSRLNTIVESQNTLEEQNMSYSLDISGSSRRDSFFEANLENFSKRSTSPLRGLSTKIDTVLLERDKNPKKSQALKILEKICEKDLEWIRSKALMNRKLLNRLIFSLYLDFYSRHEFIEDFLDYVYYDFYNRYGLKFVSDKKFVEFICSVIKASDNKKFSLFIRFLGAGHKISMFNFSQEAFQMYLDSLSFFINSKIGVCVDEDFSGKFTVPVSRVFELVKMQFESIDKGLILKVNSLVESKSVQDPKRFNMMGLVDGDTALEIVVEQFESVKVRYMEGVEFLMNILKYNEPKDKILKIEVMIVLRAVYPQQLEMFETHFEDFETISLKELLLYAIEKKVFSIEELQKFIKDEGKEVSEVEVMIGSARAEMGRIVQEIENVERMMKTLPQQVWMLKLQNLDKGVGLRRPYESIFAFRVLFLELIRVHSTFL